MASSKVGIWLIGARGAVATTSIVGLWALQKNRHNTTGLVSELPFFAHLDLVRFDDLVVGGHDIRAVPLVETAEELARQQVLDTELVKACRRELLRLDKTLRPGTLINVGAAIAELADGRQKRRQETAAEAIERIQHDLREFVKRNRLRQLIVVNVASTEPPFDKKSLPRKWADLQKKLSAAKKCPLGASTLYAIAALDLGYPYINFTPSIGSNLAAVHELAQLRDTCHMGHDGKTGETLLKTVLAPMFAHRNLAVMSWVGHNIFGNLDSKVLENPHNKETKVRSKDSALGQILGYHPQTLVSIEHIQSLGDWKTAWDHIHFKGFLDRPMKLQFTWQGSDSLLAAPLVLDLARFAEKAQAQGQRGLLKFLCSFFKSPHGVRESDFAIQYQMLLDWAREMEIGGSAL